MTQQVEAMNAIAGRMLSEGQGVEETLAYLRRSGCSVLESIKIMRDVRGGSLADAKRVVHLSRTWSDLRPSHDDLHASLETGLSGAVVRTREATPRYEEQP